YSSSADLGKTWSTPAVSSANAKLSTRMDVTIDSDDNIYLIYVSPPTPQQVGFRKYSYQGNNTWEEGPEIIIQEKDLGNSMPNICCESGGRLWVCYNNYENGDDGTPPFYVTVHYSDDGGATWSPPENVGEYNISDCGLRRSQLIIPQGQEFPWLFFPESYGRTKYFIFDGSAWSSEPLPCPDDEFAAVVTTSNGQIHMVTSPVGGVSHYYYNGSAWSGRTIVSRNGGDGARPTLTTNGTDVWCFYEGTTDTTIRYNKWEESTKSWKFATSPVLAKMDADKLWPEVNTAERIPPNFTLVPVCWTEHGQPNGRGDTCAVVFSSVPTGSVVGFESNKNNLNYNRMLMDVFPNPFTTNITLEVNHEAIGKPQVGIYDIYGRLVNNLISNGIRSSRYCYSWYGYNGKGVMQPSGTYVIKVKSGKQIINQSITLLK
ncbi:MAG: T9SS type A sorting domain-containing protein, partial [bacterium]